jgi:hypothetical protein
MTYRPFAQDSVGVPLVGEAAEAIEVEEEEVWVWVAEDILATV